MRMTTNLVETGTVELEAARVKCRGLYDGFQWSQFQECVSNGLTLLVCDHGS